MVSILFMCVELLKQKKEKIENTNICAECIGIMRGIMRHHAHHVRMYRHVSGMYRQSAKKCFYP